MSLYEYDSASVTITIDGKDITAGDMVAVNERGEVVNAGGSIAKSIDAFNKRSWLRDKWQTRNALRDAESTPEQRLQDRKEFAADLFADVTAMAREAETARESTELFQVLVVGEEVTFPDGSRGRVMSVNGSNVSVQMEGVINSISITGTVRNDETTPAQVSETAPATEAARPDHELRILRALDLARLHRVTVADLRARCSLSDSAIPLDAPHGGLCRGRYRATRSQVCDDTRMRCRGALGLYAPVLRPNIGMRWSLCRSEGVYLADWCVRMRWRCTTLRLTGMVSL